MRKIFHENIDKAQRSVDRLDKKDDKALNVGNNEEVNLQVSYALFNKVDDLQDRIELDSTLDANNKIKFLRGVSEALASFEVNFRNKAIKHDQLPSVIDAYVEAMQLELNGKSILPLIEENDLEVGQVIVRCFPFQKNAGIAESKDLLVLKECIRDPSRIMPVLRANPDVHFADSLIVIVARTQQEEIYNYAQSTNTSLGRRIHRINDPLVKTISKLATMNTGRLYFPFLDNLYKGKTTIDEIGKSLDDEYKYYRLLVNTQIDYAERMRRRDTPMAMDAVSSMLRKKAIESFINVINGLHDEPDHIRMRKVEPLNAQELYFLCVMGETEIYTSSYLKTYDRIWQRMKTPNSDSLLMSVHFDHFKKFIKVAAGYNTLDDFLRRMPKGNAEILMRSFVNGLEKTGNLEDAVDVADSYASISDNQLRKLIQEEVNKNLTQLKNADKRGYIIYDLLNNIFSSMDSGSTVDIAAKFGIPPIYNVSNASLKNSGGKIIIQQFFYGDKDGMGVFNNFRNAYRGLGWKVVEKPEWIEVSSTKGVPVIIYANRALDETKDLDSKAQESLGKYLVANKLDPTVVIHRGHSYYVKSTIEQLAPSAKVVLLGSCGGYHNLHSVLETCPYAHIIASKQVGSGTVNQPMIIEITEQLRQGKDLNWPTLWRGFEKRFVKNPLFDDYVPPHKNLGALFIMTYNKVMEEREELAVK
ncbi:hypothetical protein [Aridibaculum aurantiacum]|uniref:hypothetical protein n=1 Tax=Aridibaculum aurantiacum TaxID=2810307 RepID=UPI001A9633D5|nr:hypothetical protein [Aridibaculum aurantiacum]